MAFFSPAQLFISYPYAGPLGDGRQKDARTFEKPVSVPPQTPLLQHNRMAALRHHMVYHRGVEVG
jgi:hypothetical protein